MLQPNQAKTISAGRSRFAIVASRYNDRYVDSMLNAAHAELTQAGAKNVKIVRVPGAYEIPVVVSRLARSSGKNKSGLDAIICLGVILRGQTVHAAHIGEAVSNALMQLQVAHGIPIIHEVLLLENEAQAQARCLDPKHNRGNEAAQTALAMAQVMADLKKP
jgi:6,7-dimethyl-8-ribityllumazine synthase